MSAPAKFMFDVDFAAGAASKEPTAVPLAEHRAAVAQAEAEGRRQGVAAGEAAAAARAAAAEAEAAKRNAAALERIAGAIDALVGGFGAVEARMNTEAIEVAVAVARKLAPELIAREPFAEIAALAAECFTHLVAAPHVVVRVNDGVYDIARERLATIAHQRGFDGRLVVLAEPHIQPGDCRVEWADGGVVRDRTVTDASIADAVARHLAKRAPQGATP